MSMYIIQMNALIIRTCLLTLFLEIQNFRHNRFISFSAQNKIVPSRSPLERKKRQNEQKK